MPDDGLMRYTLQTMHLDLNLPIHECRPCILFGFIVHNQLYPHFKHVLVLMQTCSVGCTQQSYGSLALFTIILHFLFISTTNHHQAYGSEFGLGSPPVHAACAVALADDASLFEMQVCHRNMFAVCACV